MKATGLSRAPVTRLVAQHPETDASRIGAGRTAAVVRASMHGVGHPPAGTGERDRRPALRTGGVRGVTAPPVRGIRRPPLAPLGAFRSVRGQRTLWRIQGEAECLPSEVPSRSSVKVGQNKLRVDDASRAAESSAETKGTRQATSANRRTGRKVKPMTDDELERRYRELLRNPAIKRADEPRTYNVTPVDERALLDFVKRTERSHATFVHGVFENHRLS